VELGRHGRRRWRWWQRIRRLRRRGSSNLAENGCPGSVSCAGYTRRTWALRGTHLGVLVVETGAREGRTAVAWHGGDGEQSCMREGREKGEKGPAMLLTATRSFWGTCGTAESGGAAGGRGAAAKGLRGRGGSCRFCGTKATGWRLYRAVEGPRRAGGESWAPGGPLGWGKGGEEQAAGLGHAVERKKGKASWAAPCGRKRERGEKKESGPGPKRKRGRKNAFECILILI
jgi:hypothetical protein